MSGKMSLLMKFTGLTVKDLLGLGRRKITCSEEEREGSLSSAVNWIKATQDDTENGGFSQGFYLHRHGHWGWLPSYRETTGYIIESLFDSAVVFNDSDLSTRAIASADWLCSIQENDGSISNPNFGSNGLVFDTGQVLFGFVRAYEETKENRFLECAEKAGRWLCEQTDSEGLWTINTHKSCFHAYNTRVAWSLLQLWDVTGRSNNPYEKTARANLDYAVRNQKEGWYTRNSFNDDGKPFTHNIAYAIRGCWEAGCLLSDETYKNSAMEGIRTVLPYMRSTGFIPGTINESGKAQSLSCCLTGNCQLAIIMYKMYHDTGLLDYLKNGDKALSYVISCQNVKTDDSRIKGAIKGSYPITGRYTPLGYPNWATKFFIDALILRREIKK